MRLSDKDLQVAGRSTRRANKKLEEEVKKTAQKNLKKSQASASAQDKKKKRVVEQPESDASPLPSGPKLLGTEEIPNFEEGKRIENEFVEQPCIWDQAITYELQVELMLTLQRLSEHFAAALFSVQQSRPVDAVAIITSGQLLLRPISPFHSNNLSLYLVSSRLHRGHF